jgi:hypothetical protein
MSRLIACTSCHRHARVSETRCPFCGAAMPKTAPARKSPAGKFGRAALVVASTAGIAAATDLAGCTNEVVVAGDAYGLPPPDVTVDHQPDQIVAGDAYGLPADAFPPPDADDAGDGTTGDADDGGG